MSERIFLPFLLKLSKVIKDHPDDVQHTCHKCKGTLFWVFITQPGPSLYLQCSRCGQHLHPDSE